MRFYNPNGTVCNKESSVIIFRRVEKLLASTESGGTPVMIIKPLSLTVHEGDEGRIETEAVY